jgi:hypothetical protein
VDQQSEEKMRRTRRKKMMMLKKAREQVGHRLRSYNLQGPFVDLKVQEHLSDVLLRLLLFVLRAL